MPQVDVNFQIIAPVVTLAVGALAVILLDLVLPAGRSRNAMAAVTVAGILLAGWYGYGLWQRVTPAAAPPEWNVTPGDVTQAPSAFLGAVVADGLGLWFGGVALAAALGSVAMSVRRREEDVSGYFALILLAATGMVLLASGASLLTIFLGLELLSLALYVVVGVRRDDARGKEGAFKYLVLGAVASGILLYGFALLYGATGSVWLAEFQAYWFAHGEAGMTALFKAGLALTIVGFAFKLALVPFHAWAPDAYEGAPASVSAFMAVGTKAAALAALIRILSVAVPQEALGSVLAPLSVLAALSMFVGSILATRQTNMKRLLAYSGIAHAGYLLMAVPGLAAQGVAAAGFYALGYLCMTLGAFAVVIWLGDDPEAGPQIGDYEALFYRRPVLAGLLALFLLAMAGMPATAGFVGKLLLIRNALDFGETLLVASLVITTGISAYAYLRVVLTMMKRPAAETAALPGLAEAAAARDDAAAPPAEGQELAFSWPLTVLLAVAAVGTIVLGVLPEPFLLALASLWPA